MTSDNPALPDADSPPPRSRLRSALAIVGMVVLVVALPVLIFAAVHRIFGHLSRATENANTRQLHRVGLAVRQWADDHGGTYPPSLADLVDARLMPAALLAIPGTGGRDRYTYLGDGLTERTAANGTVLAYEPKGANEGHGNALLFADGGTAWVAADRLALELKDGTAPGRRREDR